MFLVKTKLGAARGVAAGAMVGGLLVAGAAMWPGVRAEGAVERPTVHLAPAVSITAPPRAPETVYVFRGEAVPAGCCEPGDVLIAVYPPFTPELVDECEDSGGEPIWIPATDVYQCEDVDF